MPDRYVLDSTVVVSSFLPDQESHGAAARVLRMAAVGECEVLAPESMRYEFANAMTKAYRLRGRAFSELSEAFDDFAVLPIVFVEVSPALLKRAAFLAHTFRKSFYDMGYFALAEAHAVPVCTADVGSVFGLGRGFPARHVLLSEFSG